jgi:hypothetical protein
MRWAQYVARMGEKINAYRFLLKKPESDHLEYLDVQGRILKWLLKTRNGTAWTGCIWLGKWISGGQF